MVYLDFQSLLPGILTEAVPLQSKREGLVKKSQLSDNYLNDKKQRVGITGQFFLGGMLGIFSLGICIDPCTGKMVRKMAKYRCYCLQVILNYFRRTVDIVILVGIGLPCICHSLSEYMHVISVI